MGKQTTTKASKVSRQKKTKTEKNERRRNKRMEKQLNSSKPPRSPNRFILYRKYIQNKINTDPNNPANMRDLSKKVAEMWDRESPEVKQYWDQIAERIKLNSSYRSSFDVINGLDMSISESDITDITFVNATASSSQSSTKKNRKNKSHTTPIISNPILAENFIMESPESNIPQIPSSNPSNPQWMPLSPQSPQSPFFSQSPLSPQSPLPLQYQQTPQTPQTPQTSQTPHSPQYQQYPQPQSPQTLQYLPSPQLASDEDPSFVSSPSPLLDGFDCFEEFPEMHTYSILPPLFDLGPMELEQHEPDYFYSQSMGPIEIEQHEPDYFVCHSL